MTRRDTQTLDLFADYKPAPVVARFDEADVRAATLAARLSRAVAATLRDSKLSRAAIAEGMATFLGEDVPLTMLEAYASQAKEKHQISAVRLIALAVVAKDERLLNALLNGAGLIAVPQRYELLIRRERAKELRTQLDREIAATEAEWSASR